MQSVLKKNRKENITDNTRIIVTHQYFNEMSIYAMQIKQVALLN